MTRVGRIIEDFLAVVAPLMLCGGWCSIGVLLTTKYNDVFYVVLFSVFGIFVAVTFITVWIKYVRRSR